MYTTCYDGVWTAKALLGPGPAPCPHSALGSQGANLCHSSATAASAKRRISGVEGSTSGAGAARLAGVAGVAGVPHGTGEAGAGEAGAV